MTLATIVQGCRAAGDRAGVPETLTDTVLATLCAPLLVALVAVDAPNWVYGQHLVPTP